jgi:antibiotic biosynthesis monooxygenase (ABM) superfamily enzyme
MVIVLIRTQLRPDADVAAHDQLDARMFELVQTIPGFVSARSYSSDDIDERSEELGGGDPAGSAGGAGGNAPRGIDRISLIRFASGDALRAWREHPEHREVQRRGRDEFFAAYDVEVCDVTRSYEFGRTAPGVRTGDAGDA